MPFLRKTARVVYNGIRAREFDPVSHEEAGRALREELAIPASAKVVCSVAGFRPEKNHDVLLDAFSKVRDSLGDEIYLLLAGSGQQESALKTQAAALGIDDRVCFLGALADVKPVLAAADCKVLASKAETFSMAMLESMSMAVPVISTNVGGAGEAITDRESGMLVTPGDADVLVDALQWLLEDDDRLRMVGDAARQSVLQSFRYHTMIMRSAEFLVDAVAESPK